MLEIRKDNVLIAYQQLEQYQLDRYGRGVVSAIDRNRDIISVNCKIVYLYLYKLQEMRVS
mgnify:FL=1